MAASYWAALSEVASRGLREAEQALDADLGYRARFQNSCQQLDNELEVCYKLQSGGLEYTVQTCLRDPQSCTATLASKSARSKG